jgi:DNA polymerase-3 subunit delta'
MSGFLTRGHPAAVAAIAAMIAGPPPHALLIAGPPGVGKTTLALDLAAGLLCDAQDPADRPCRACRGCRLVDSGGHADLHRLVPGGAGDQIRIGDRSEPETGTIRRLISELALLPVEGGASPSSSAPSG